VTVGLLLLVGIAVVGSEGEEDGEMLGMAVGLAVGGVLVVSSVGLADGEVVDLVVGPADGVVEPLGLGEASPLRGIVGIGVGAVVDSGNFSVVGQGVILELGD